MNKYFIISIFTLLTLLCHKAEAFWNPFDYIHFAKPGSTDISRYSEVKNTVDGLISAYESRNISSFMRFVSEEYTNDEDILESNIRNDFHKYSFIRINYVINNIIPDNRGKYSVSINFTRQLEDRKTGEITSRTGTSELLLKEEDGSYKLYSMRRQRLFGIN